MDIIFLPDISFYKTSKTKKEFINFEFFLKQIKKKFKNYEIFVNLENVLLSKKTKPKNIQKFNLYSDTEFADFLSKYNIKNICLSNNHIFDFGYNGFLQTTKSLKKRNISFFGAGKNIKEAQKPITLKNKNKKCFVFGLSYKPCATNTKPGVFDFKDIKSLNYIKKYKKKNKSSFIIIYCHSGLELFEYPLIKDEKIYKKFIDNGADIIIGSHPHRTQGFEKYKNKFIFYSIGDLFVENTSKRDWHRYITSPAHASIYKKNLSNKILFESYMIKINTTSKSVDVYKIFRDKHCNYKMRKINKNTLEKNCFDYKKKIKNNFTKIYRNLIEDKVFKNAR